jgi:hypothetical protein
LDPIRLGPDDGDRILECVELHGHLLKPSKVSVGLPEDMRNYESLLNAMILFFTSIILGYFGLATYEHSGTERNRKDVKVEQIKAANPAPTVVAPAASAPVTTNGHDN